MKKILSLTAFLTVAFIFLVACQNAAPPVSIEAIKTNPVAPKVNEHGHTDDAPRITLADAKKEFDAGNAIFVDTRAEAAYKNEHIKGSINMTTADVEARYKELPTDKKIIAYCSWPSEHTSASLVTKLQEKGIKNAFALLGGTAAWKNAGYPMGKAEQK